MFNIRLSKLYNVLKNKTNKQDGFSELGEAN